MLEGVLMGGVGRLSCSGSWRRSISPSTFKMVSLRWLNLLEKKIKQQLWQLTRPHILYKQVLLPDNGVHLRPIIFLNFLTILNMHGLPFHIKALALGHTVHPLHLFPVIPIRIHVILYIYNIDTSYAACSTLRGGVHAVMNQRTSFTKTVNCRHEWFTM